MNLIYGEITALFTEQGMRMAKIRVNGAVTHTCLELTPKAHTGDWVLLCDGVAIETIVEETNHVSGNPR